MCCEATIELTLRARGLRVTTQRRQLVIALSHAEAHSTIEELQQRVEREFGPPGIPTPTAYRTIEVLKQHGLVSEITSDQGSSRFEWVDPAHPHHHLRCAVCGADEQVEFDGSAPNAIERALVGARAFEPFTQHFVLTGVCNTCRAAREPASTPQATE